MTQIDGVALGSKRDSWWRAGVAGALMIAALALAFVCGPWEFMAGALWARWNDERFSRRPKRLGEGRVTRWTRAMLRWLFRADARAARRAARQRLALETRQRLEQRRRDAVARRVELARRLHYRIGRAVLMLFAAIGGLFVVMVLLMTAFGPPQSSGPAAHWRVTVSGRG